MPVNFYVEKRIDKRGDAAIRVSISIRGSRFATSSGQKIPPAKWNQKKHRVKQGASNGAGHPYNLINAALAKIEDIFCSYESQCLKADTYPTIDDLKQVFAENISKKRKLKLPSASDSRLLPAFDNFVCEMGTVNQWAERTLKNFGTLKNHLVRFNGSLTFDDLDERGLNEFANYLRDKANLRNSTIAKLIKLLKWFLRWAFSKGHHTNTAYQTFSPKLKTAVRKVIYLEWDELMRVFNYEVPANGTDITLTDADGMQYVKRVHDAAAIAKTRDIFCLCCFTSLRYSDAINLKHSDIANGKITITTIKTADTLTIELNKYALAILGRYCDYHSADGHVFPPITNQRMNEYLKDLCELCEINRPITQIYYRGSERFEETRPKYELIGTHCGRRTFICNALSLGIPAEIVMKWTGHSDYKSMKPYVDIVNKAKANAMDLFNRI